MHGWKMQDWNMKDQLYWAARPEIWDQLARLEMGKCGNYSVLGMFHSVERTNKKENIQVQYSFTASRRHTIGSRIIVSH